MSAYFVTSSGTGIGKTFVTAGLVRAARAAAADVAALKPIVSGFDMALAALSDTGILLEALDRPITPESLAQVSPWRFSAPLSPDMAAAKEGRALALDEIVAHSREAIAREANLLIEGVGGVMVPLSDQHTVLDWMAAVQIPAILVVGTYLGSISHTLTAAHALKDRSVPIAAVVLNDSGTGEVSHSDTRQTLSRFLVDVPIVDIPRVKTRVKAEAEFSELWERLAG